MKIKYLSLLLLVCLRLVNVQAQALQKKYFNAVAVSVAPDSILKRHHVNNGLLISKVLPTGTAANAGLLAGDIIVDVNHIAVKQVMDLKTGQLSKVRAGDSVTYGIIRDGLKMKATGIAVGKPDEKNADITYTYQSIPFGNGKLNSIISTPTKNLGKRQPTLLLIQGYTCGEMVDLDTAHPYRRLADGLTRAGYRVMRVEKPGVGDCMLTPACESIDFDVECNAFEQALLYLKKDAQTDTNQIFIWGHSLGGIIAPVLTNKYPWIKGAIVYGTLSRIWGEYLLHMTRLQSEGFGMAPVELEQMMRGVRKILYEIYTLKKSPTQFVKENPKLEELLKSEFMWKPGTDLLFTRSAKFNQSLDALNVTDLWSKTSCKVLGIYGEADIEALNPEGTIALINTVNYYHPGNGKYQLLKGTDHSFAKVGDIQDGYRTKALPNYGSIMMSNFNPEVVDMSAQWLKKVVSGQPMADTPKAAHWQKLPTEKYAGKQDDICFINEQTGWYVNGGGNIYKTNDGGLTWKKCFNKPGTFFRCIAFVDSLTGFVGNVGTEYFPNVKDTIPLYKTTDGGNTWQPVAYTGPYVKGLCAIDLVKEQVINHGAIGYVYHIYAVGRVGSPANIMVSHDGGNSFQSWSMESDAKMLFDIKMFNKKEGFVCAATNEDVAQSNALILFTKDGGKSWEKKYQSTRPYETTWKTSFPTRDTGYVTIQQYNPDKAVTKQRVAATTDGGNTWTELDLCNDYQAREFGVGFLNATHGFVGTMTSGYETKDGGKTWEKTDLGRACNKIRIYTSSEGKQYGYAIGVDVLKLVE